MNIFIIFFFEAFAMLVAVFGISTRLFLDLALQIKQVSYIRTFYIGFEFQIDIFQTMLFRIVVEHPTCFGRLLPTVQKIVLLHPLIIIFITN